MGDAWDDDDGKPTLYNLNNPVIERTAPPTSSKSKLVIMKRSEPRQQMAPNQEPVPAVTVKTAQQREQEYNAARAAIFGTPSPRSESRQSPTSRGSQQKPRNTNPQRP